MGDIKHGILVWETLATNLPWMGMVSIAPIKMRVLGDGLWHWLYHTSGGIWWDMIFKWDIHVFFLDIDNGRLIAIEWDIPTLVHSHKPSP